MPMQNPGQYQQKSKPTPEEGLPIPPTLVEMGISYKQSSEFYHKWKTFHLW